MYTIYTLYTYYTFAFLCVTRLAYGTEVNCPRATLPSLCPARCGGHGVNLGC